MKKFISIQKRDGSEQLFTETDLPLVIGSDPECHISLSGTASVVAHIGHDHGHLFIQPYEKNNDPLFHNDRLLSESAWLKSQDQVRCARNLLVYELSGDRIVFTVTEAEPKSASQTLRPPPGPPPVLDATGNSARQLPVHIDGTAAPSSKKKITAVILACSFLLLGLAVFFVLSARPLDIHITPDPDSVSISGFPPAFPFGSSYLCLPGTYDATVLKEGYIPFATTIVIDKTTDNQLVVALEKLPGILSLSITPPGKALIYSGDTLLATTPPDSVEIRPGHHNITIIKERYQSFKTEIDIEGQGKVQLLEAALKPDWAQISFISDPPGARVAIDEAISGVTPLTLELLSGPHQITMVQELYSEALLDIAVTAGKAETHTVVLQSLPAQLLLTSTPSKAAISIDKTYRGTTPRTISLSSRTEHEIVLTAPGHKPARHLLTLSPGEEQKLTLSLEQELGVVYLTTHPPDAHITINGKRYSNTQGKLSLPAASQTLEVKAPGYKAISRTIVPKVGFSQQISIELAPATAEGTTVPGSRFPEETLTTLTSAAGQKLLLVHPSPFTMGAPRREPGRRANERERTVIMTKPFYLSEKLVTNREYRQFNKQHAAGMIAGNTLDSDEQPVVKIRWEDAVKYLNWLSVRDNLQPFYVEEDTRFIPASPPTNGYRLPTEAEWAFSARQMGSATRQRFPWSGTFPPRTITGNYADESARTFLPTVIRGYGDKFPVSSPVGSFPANKGGFFDMGGNVGEWCHDYYTPYTGSLHNQPDPIGPSSGTHRVIRGSSWRDSSITELRLSYRAYHREARDNVGFRIASYP